jgi:hypothetical protein
VEAGLPMQWGRRAEAGIAPHRAEGYIANVLFNGSETAVENRGCRNE